MADEKKTDDPALSGFYKAWKRLMQKRLLVRHLLEYLKVLETVKILT
jgi:hypothetical protein